MSESPCRSVSMSVGRRPEALQTADPRTSRRRLGTQEGSPRRRHPLVTPAYPLLRALDRDRLRLPPMGADSFDQLAPPRSRPLRSRHGVGAQAPVGLAHPSETHPSLCPVFAGDLPGEARSPTVCNLPHQIHGRVPDLHRSGLTVIPRASASWASMPKRLEPMRRRMLVSVVMVGLLRSLGVPKASALGRDDAMTTPHPLGGPARTRRRRPRVRRQPGTLRPLLGAVLALLGLEARRQLADCCGQSGLMTEQLIHRGGSRAGWQYRASNSA